MRIVRETGKPIAQVARELGVNEGTLGNWVTEDRKRREGGDAALDADERAELVRLRREVAELKMQRDVLKRSVASGSRGDGPVAVAAFIVSQREGHGVPYAVACRALGVSQSWFFKWRTGVLPPSARRRGRLDAEVAALFAARQGKDGEPRITAALREAGWRVSRKAVAASLACQGLLARPGRRGRRGTTRRGKARWRAEDLPRGDRRRDRGALVCAGARDRARAHGRARPADARSARTPGR